MITRTYALLLLLACSEPRLPQFVMPKSVEDVRARLLVHIPEGRDIEGARGWMRDHGFDCDKPLPSATDAHAHVCRADSAHADAGWVRWTVVLYERRGRLADVQARGP